MRDDVDTRTAAGTGPQRERAARGELLELYRNYLRLVARSLIGSALRVKLEPSDLVQETFLKAHREFTQFAAGREPELVAWLRQILVRSLANQVKHHRRQARDHQRQESLEQLLERSSLSLQQALASSLTSPSERRAGASRRCCWPMPWIVCPPTTARPSSCVPWSTSRSRRSPPEMGRSAGAVRMLWARAVKRLTGMLEEEA